MLSLDIAKASGWDCVCEIQQLEGRERRASLRCRTNVGDNVEPVASGARVVLRRSVDPARRRRHRWPTCPSTEQRKIRFTGKGEAQQGATLFITCSGE